MGKWFPICLHNVNIMFTEHKQKVAYLNEGLLGKKWVILFDRMRNTRHSGKYSFQVEPIKEEVESGIKSAENFFKKNN